MQNVRKLDDRILLSIFDFTIGIWNETKNAIVNVELWNKLNFDEMSLPTLL